MKRVIFLALGLVLVLVLCACGQEAAVVTTAPRVLITVNEGDVIDQLDDVSVYAPVTGDALELVDLPAYRCSQGSNAPFFSPNAEDPWVGLASKYKGK